MNTMNELKMVQKEIRIVLSAIDKIANIRQCGPDEAAERLFNHIGKALADDEPTHSNSNHEPAADHNVVELAQAA